eukprot:g4842.t1
MSISTFSSSCGRLRCVLCNRRRPNDRIRVLTSHRHSTWRIRPRLNFICFTIKPGEDPEVVDAEICEEDLPDSTNDPLMGVFEDEEELDIPDMDPKRRRTKIIIDLVNAGGAFEEKLELYSEYLNEELLEVFYKRIELAKKFEDKETISGLKMIWRRIRAELERKRASPGIRLLDELLSILHPASGGTQQERCRRALGVMYEAFSQSQTDGVDIFELAESLAEGKPPPETLSREQVQRDEFINELKELLVEVKDHYGELMEKRAKLIEDMKQPNSSQNLYEISKDTFLICLVD